MEGILVEWFPYYPLSFLVINIYLKYFLPSDVKLSVHCTKCNNAANIVAADWSSVRKDGLGKWLFQVTIMWIVWRIRNCCLCVENYKHVASRNINLFKAAALIAKMFLFFNNFHFLVLLFFDADFPLPKGSKWEFFLAFVRPIPSTASYSVSQRWRCLGFNLCCKNDPAKDCCGAVTSRIACVCQGKLSREERESCRKWGEKPWSCMKWNF